MFFFFFFILKFYFPQKKKKKKKKLKFFSFPTQPKRKKMCRYTTSRQCCRKIWLVIDISFLIMTILGFIALFTTMNFQTKDQNTDDTKTTEGCTSVILILQYIVSLFTTLITMKRNFFRKN